MDFLTVPTLTGRVRFVLVLPVASPPAHRACQHHGSSDGHLVRSTSGRRISGRYGALLVPTEIETGVTARSSSAAWLAWASPKLSLRVRDQRGPLLPRESLVHDPRLSGVALPGAPEKERARKAWIVEDPERARVLQPPPQRLALAP